MGVIAKYKFNNTLADLLPEFNSEFTSDLYTITDEVNGEVTTRTIESDSLPTLMRFGRVWVDGESAADNRTDSLLEVLGMNTNGLTSCDSMFRYCKNLTSITCEWNTSNVTTMNSMFAYCSNLTTLDLSNWDTSNVTTMRNMFHSCNNLTSLDVSNFDTSNVDNMYQMFYGCNNLTTLDVSNFNTSNVTNMKSMFNKCNKLTTLDVSKWNTSNVTDMAYIFQNCNNLTTLDVSNFNTTNVNNMSNMFCNCNNLTTLDVSNFDTNKVTNMSNMFNKCNKLTTLDVSNFDTSKVTTMEGMFSNCQSLTSLDVSNFDTSNVTSMYAMFGDCHALISIEGINNFDVRKVQNFGNIFISCRTLQHLDLHNWTTSTDAQHQGMFAYCNNLHTIDISNFIFLGSSDGRKLLFYNSPNIKYIKCNNIITIDIIKSQLPTKSSTSQGTIICKSDITNLDTTALQSKYWNILDEPTLIAKYVFDKSIHNNCIPEFNTEFEGYFIEDEVEEGSNEVTRTIESCGMLPTLMIFGSNLDTYVEGREVALLEILNMNTSGLTSCGNMFRYCKNLTSITCEWDTSNVTAMSYMFRNCKLLTPLDVSNWDTSNVTTMRDMFYGCNKLTSLDVSNWNTSNVTNMAYMFSGCSNLITLDVSNWNTSNVIYIHAMFTNCSNLTSLDISNWNTSNVTNTTNMFSNTPLLTDISVLYMDKSNLQKLIDAMPTDSNKTLWYKDVNIDGITHGNNITLKKYMEGNVEIVLNSPLLEGDRIEVKNGKLCHVHRYEKVVLDGSENWQSPHNFFWIQKKYLPSPLKEREAKKDSVVFVDTLIHGYIDNNTANQISTNRLRLAIQDTSNGGTNIRIILKDIKDNDIDGLKQWLQANPTTVVYELETPYYEDITNLQSAPTLKTYLECSMEIDTDLPIDTNITYRTNLSSVYVMERELDELDNGTDLGDILEGEVNE